MTNSTHDQHPDETSKAAWIRRLNADRSFHPETGRHPGPLSADQIQARRKAVRRRTGVTPGYVAKAVRSAGGDPFADPRQ